MRISTLLGAGLCFLATSLTRGQGAITKVGGRTPVDVHDEGVQKAANFAFEKLTAIDGDPVISYEVTKAERQVVAGLIYYLSVEVKGATACQLHDVTIYDHFGEYSITGRKVGPCDGEGTADKIDGGK